MPPMSNQPSTAFELDERFLQVQYLPVDADQADQRIDNFLVARLKGVPRTHVYKLLRKGEVRVNKGRVRADYRLRAGDLVRLPPMKVAQKAPPKQLSQGLGRVLGSSIVYEDDGLLVVNKPPGLAVHGGSDISLGLIEALRQLRPEARYLELVHRLDRDTSGCIMVAKKRSYLRHLQQARSEEHTSELQSRPHLVCRLLLEKKKKQKITSPITSIPNTSIHIATTLCINSHRNPLSAR